MPNRSHADVHVPTLTRACSRLWPGTENSHVFTVSPTDLAFLWADCPRCFYRKVVWGVPRPRGPFPLVFNRIDRAMKRCFDGQRSDGFGAEVPSGVIGGIDRSVRSTPFALPGSGPSLVIHGRVDALVACDDDTVAIIDFKTADPRNPNLAAYSRQLHAYATALEQPSVGPATIVSGLGLLSFSPEHFESNGQDAALRGGLSWTEIPFERQRFSAFLGQVLDVLDQPEAPPASSSCPWCERTANSSAA